jgi:hypothetical protein
MGHFMKQTVFKPVLIAVCLVGQSWSVALADEGSLNLPTQANGNVELVRAEGGLGQPSDILQVFVGAAEACCGSKIPMAGIYSVEGESVIFDPTFDLVMGQNYTVLTHDAARQLTEFAISADSAATTPEVVAIYPSAADIPENTLRFYIHFSEPMQPHMSTEFIKLVDANGTADVAAFMTFKQELWNEDRTRLTLLMDPGRIKRGVATNLDLGPALLAGDSYSIVVEGGWPNARDGQEAAQFEQPFTVSPPLRVLPDTELWKFQRPELSTIDPLTITFDRPFDHQLTQTAITVRDEDGHIVPGKVSVENFEQTWHFTPDAAWSTPTIRIVVDARLEDVAGNNFRELLDHSVETDVADIDQKTIHLDLRPSSE